VTSPRPSLRLQAALVALLLAGSSGCASLTGTQKGAIVGAGTGAVVGGVIGNQTGSTTRGAIIGAILGGAAGGIIGHRMDQQAKELKQTIPGAVVERVGEGIQVTFASGLLFDTDSDVIRSAARSNLTALAQNLGKYDDTNLLIVGHTDAVGTEEYNQGLSERRAESASRFLASQGVTRSIATRGLGEMEPVASNETAKGRRLNRRVEVAIYASPALQEKAKQEAGSR